MAHTVQNFEFKGYRSHWRVGQDFMTMSHTVVVMFHIPDSWMVLSASNNPKEDFYAEVVDELAKALGELKGHLLGTQNP